MDRTATSDDCVEEQLSRTGWCSPMTVGDLSQSGHIGGPCYEVRSARRVWRGLGRKGIYGRASTTPRSRQSGGRWEWHTGRGARGGRRPPTRRARPPPNQRPGPPARHRRDARRLKDRDATFEAQQAPVIAVCGPASSAVHGRNETGHEVKALRKRSTNDSFRGHKVK